MKNMDKIKLIYYPERMILLNFISNHSGIIKSKIAHKMEKPFSFISKITISFEKIGLIRCEKKGRDVIVSMTPRGIELAKHIQEIMDVDFKEDSQ